MIRFGAVGLIGAGVNLGVLWVLYGQLRLPGPLASALAVEVSIVGNFIGNNRFTFGERTMSAARFVRYNLTSLGGLGITFVTFTVLTQRTLNPYLAQVVGIGLATGWNFAASVLWTWAP